VTFTTLVPRRWPEPPDTFSFSALQTARRCPRRWAYAAAEFAPGGLADANGRLVRRASWPALRGVVVHGVLEDLLNIHREGGGPTSGWALVRFWAQRLPAGGVGALVAARAASAIEKATAQPRTAPLRPTLARCAADDHSAMVAAVNSRLTHALALAPSERPHTPAGGAGRPTLRAGATPEVWLKCVLRQGDLAYRWRGGVDVIRVAGPDVELLDYKTGAEKPDHRRQLEIYALLLARDGAYNPEGRLATRLALIYDGHRVDWTAPAAHALNELERDVVVECDEVSKHLAAAPPVAKVGDQCGGCDVRLLCDPYWAEPDGASATLAVRRADLEVTLVSGARDRSEVAGTLRTGEHVRLIAGPAARATLIGTRFGDRVRVTSAHRVTATADDGELAAGDVFELDAWSEAASIEAPTASCGASQLA
jgi:hypothetical protein